MRFLLPMSLPYCTGFDAGQNIMLQRKISLGKQQKYCFPTLQNAFTLDLIAVRHN